MITKALAYGDRVLTVDWDGLVLLAKRPGAGTFRAVDYVERNVGGGKATNRVHFIDGTSALASAGDFWIVEAL